MEYLTSSGCDVKWENYYPQPEQKSDEKTRASSGSAADSSSIHFCYICTVQQIEEIVQILTWRYKHNSKCHSRQGKIFNTEMRDLPHIYLVFSPWRGGLIVIAFLVVESPIAMI